MLDFLDSPTFTLMRKELDVLWQRESVITENITNKDTPHYKAKRVLFESILDDKIKNIGRKFGSFGRTEENLMDTIRSTEAQVVTDNRTEEQADGNNVDIDSENVELARTKIQYDYMIRKITDEYNLLKKAINEGKG